MTMLGRLVGSVRLKKDAAVEWFRKGVKAAHAGAMEELARICAEGKLAPKDMAGALKLARRGTCPWSYRLKNPPGPAQAGR